jgi:hypothetical protein
MALNRPFGLSPNRHGNGNAYNGQVTRYRIPSADGSAYFIGDIVKQVAGADVSGVSNVQKGTGTLVQRGFIIGVENPTVGGVSIQGTVIDSTVTNVPAVKTRDYYVYVCDDPDIVFTIQDDGITAGNLVAASANLNSSTTITAPALPYQLSSTVLLSSSFATTVGLQLKLLGLAQYPVLAGGSPNAFGAFGVWLARWNQHELMGNQVGI